jgi:general L-amino acid transport system permease protein
VLPYRPSNTFAWAFVVGLANTLMLSVVIGAASTGLGQQVALARRSITPLAKGVSTTFVETMRNTPLVVQLLFWYALVTVGLPNVHAALNPAPGVFLADRGLYFPALSFVDWRLTFDVPHLERFNYVGGAALTPELVALLLGLILYSAAFVGEIIRGGVDAIGVGQWEAGRAVGLSERQTLRLVIVPQALRVIIPPMTSQYINIVKNTTLALVVGYPDISSVTATTINQTGQAVEGILILMAVFLALSLSASLFMNWYNRRVALVTR